VTSSIPQKKLREIVFQILFSHDLAQPDVDDLIPFMCEQTAVSKSHMRVAYARAEAILAVRQLLDDKITTHCREYALERIPRVERNILRLALYELFEEKSIPPKVVIAEALRLGRKFSSPEAGGFLNAILDAAYKAELTLKIEGEEDKEAIFFGSEGLST
jgi:transcription antitermination protein NusB